MKSKKLLILVLFMVAANFSYSQVGINTDNPKAELDINGDLQVRKELLLPSTETPGTLTAGKVGQVIMSQGADKPAIWADFNLPSLISGEYVLKSTVFKEDRIGVSLTEAKTNPITDATKLDANWSEIPNLSIPVTTTNSKNRILITLQTVFISDFSGDGLATPNWANIICGIFENDKLISARQDQVTGGYYPLRTFTMIYALDDLPVGSFDLRVAFQRRDSSTSAAGLPIHVGQGGDPSVSNAFMDKSILRIDIFEQAKTSTTP